MRRMFRPAAAFLLLPMMFVLASPEPPKSGYSPKIAKASDEAQKAIARFQIDKSLKVDLWAAEPMLAHPVSFCFDEKGVCYVAESFRINNGVTDTRGHMYWLDDDLACRTVADRVAMYKKHAKEKFSQGYERERERVRRLEDTTGSGRADRSTVFRDDFGRAEDGIAAGVLARKGNVYFTCIPDIWMMKDTKGTGVADERQSFATGFGVHTGFYGHDMHGLVIGPDGRLYFSIGDRGLNVTTKEGKHLYCPDSGAVIRCELDGSNMELFATGLRNPQELAFDDFGNLFTVDNNSDSGDQARFVHIVPGGDSGWRMGYQYQSSLHDETVKQGNRGAWNYDLLWKAGEVKAAYTVPPVANFSNGPSGFAHYPGVGLNAKYKGHFFLCNFSGTASASGIYAFTTKPRGSSFQLTGDHKFIWNVLTTDCEFAPDGSLYLSDWFDGWGLTGKGRIYKVTDPEAVQAPEVAEAKKLLAEGLDRTPIDQLVKLLNHAHQKVRQEAQFALANHGANGLEALEKVARDANAPRVSRLHAIWAIAQVLRTGNDKSRQAVDRCAALLADKDAEVRAQAAFLFGEVRLAPTPAEKLFALLADPEPRVQLLACQALSQIYRSPAQSNEVIAKPIFDMMRKAGNDPYLRNAASVALANAVPAKMIAEATADSAVSVRLTAVVALRRKQSQEVISFLNDADPAVAAEAARAIDDMAIEPARKALAAALDKSDANRPVAYRALNSHFLAGQPENARALASYASRTTAPAPLRALAMNMLAEWPKPSRRDFISGATQSLPPRSPREPAEAFAASLDAVFAGPPELQAAAIKAAVSLQTVSAVPHLTALVGKENARAELRIDALKAIETLKSPELTAAASLATKSTDGKVRNAGRSVLFKTNPKLAVDQLRTVLAGKNIPEMQGAFDLLVANPSDATNELLEEWLDLTIQKKAPAEVWLDVLEAASKSKSERIQRRWKGFDANRTKDDPIGGYREALAGGDVAKGRNVFINKAAVQCQRCHKVDGQGGEVGPPVNGIGKQTAEYLLESIVIPNKAIAKGYDSVLITTLDGKSITGVLRGEDEKEVKIITAEGKPITIKKADIDERKATKSAMPEDIITKLSKRELRDLIAFLASLKKE